MAHIVLVHGMLATEASWFDIPDNLRAAGHTVKNFTLPGHKPSIRTLTTSLDDYVKSVEKRFPKKGECCLVGHSMGGMVISQAASLNPDRVARLIYVAAMLPKDGEAMDDIMRKSNTSIGLIRKAFDEHGLEYSPPVFGVQPIRPLNDPFEESAEFGSVPRYFIKTTNDDVLTTLLQNNMIEEWPGTNVRELPTNHFPQVSDPDLLTKVLLELLP